MRITLFDIWMALIERLNALYEGVWILADPPIELISNRDGTFSGQQSSNCPTTDSSEPGILRSTYAVQQQQAHYRIAMQRER